MKVILRILFFGIFFSHLTSFAIKPGRIIPGEESYVNDIPFDTHQIFCEYLINETLNVKLPDEAVVDDIPFNTSEIAACAMGQYLDAILVLPAEEYVDDIPFDTCKVASHKLRDKK